MPGLTYCIPAWLNRNGTCYPRVLINRAIVFTFSKHITQSYTQIQTHKKMIRRLKIYNKQHNHNMNPVQCRGVRCMCVAKILQNSAEK